MRNGFIVVIVYAALLTLGALVGHIRGDRDARDRIIAVEMQNAALKSANEMLLRSARINHSPIYVDIDRRNSQGGNSK